MTLSPELLTMIKDVQPATDEELSDIVSDIARYDPLEIQWDGRQILSLIARIVERDEMASALRRLVDVIKAAGLHNLSNGVQLGQTSWYVKASDAMEFAESALSALERKS